MKPRLLLLTAGYGEGHNAAARALLQAAQDRFGSDQAHCVDVFALASPGFNRASRWFYRILINRGPGAWCLTYRWVDRNSQRLTRAAGLLQRERAALGRVLAKVKPSIICSTYPLYGLLLERLASPLPPHWVVVTDSISVNSLWWRGRCDRWLVPNVDTAEVLRQAGVRRAQVEVLGFPVAPDFARPAGFESRPDLRAANRPRVLMLLNSSAGPARDMARHLVTQTDWQFTCAVTRDEAMRRELTQLAAGRPEGAEILGWTDRVPALLHSHHVVISKAGGATTQEALAAGCPLLVNQVVPGQEEGNWELIRRHGAGARVTNWPELERTLTAAFADQGRLWRDWAAAARRLGRPCAARAIIQQLAAVGAGADQPAVAR